MLPRLPTLELDVGIFAEGARVPHPRALCVSDTEYRGISVRVPWFERTLGGRKYVLRELKIEKKIANFNFRFDNC